MDAFDDAPRSPGPDPAGPLTPDPAGPPGLDLHRLAEYLAKACPGMLSEPLRAEVIAGGKSNLTYRVTGSDRVTSADRVRGPDEMVVLRRPPLGHVLPTAHDMSREYRIIAALHPAGFPVPVPLHLCVDPDVIGAPFYLMSHVDGVVLGRAQEIEALSPEQARRASELLVDTLAELHRVDPAALGLADFGRPEGFLERQVRRWHGQWERSKTRELARLEEVATTLAATAPASQRAGIVHGDYRLDNVMFGPGIERIAAVLDWEMATLGDPLTDVGLLVVYTELAADGLGPTLPRLDPALGFLAASDLVSRYGEQVGTAINAPIGWYVALGYYKLAIVSEGIHARYLRGKTVGAGFEQLGASVPVLIDRARAALRRPVRDGMW